MASNDYVWYFYSSDKFLKYSNIFIDLHCKYFFTHCSDVEIKIKNTDRDQVRSVLPQASKGTEE